VASLRAKPLLASRKRLLTQTVGLQFAARGGTQARNRVVYMVCTLDQKTSQIDVAGLGDAEQRIAIAD
jgi:hypothetical protein